MSKDDFEAFRDEFVEFLEISHYEATGDSERFARWVAESGPVTERGRQLVADAVRGKGPRKRLNGMRDQEIILMIHEWTHGGEVTITQATELAAECFNLSVERIEQILKDYRRWLKANPEQ